jgi:hypothetical protein
MNSIRYHIQLNSHRTTVSMDTILSDLLSIKLGTRPGTKEAHKAVRQQIDEFIERDRGRPGYGVAKYVTEQAMLFISDSKLSEKYWEYRLEEYDNIDC